MPSERMQRRIDAFLDQAEEASDAGDWQQVAEKASAALAIDENNEDAAALLKVAEAGLARSGSARAPSETTPAIESNPPTSEAEPPESPESFAGGRYKVLRFLGEGGKKRVFLAHDALLDRDVAFSLIKTEGLDDVGRERIMREARAMGRLTHPNIVAIFDIGEHTAADGSKQPYLVQELMGGGDVEGLLEDAEGPLPLQQALDIAISTARGLEFAHAQNVVHRDLKPGNVWLTGDGVAKIGDLGLAVTLGQSRLTSHGMMVGTYGYMPPEQALGEQVTPLADLYSLGAMLYELVTGRPPFQGDSPTAVISQHLNTEPVAPSWYTEHCPPPLEALILQLLAKVPADRPASASDVIAALERVDPDARSASHSDSGANPLDRLARGIFVGREPELEQLRSSLDAALRGRGSLVMLVGEPGIGKTRTAQELETYARMRGAAVYWGRTHESAGMPAYWPWLQIGRAWGATQDFAATTLPNFNPEMLRFFPELRELRPGLPEPSADPDSESAQFLLFDAYAQFMRARSEEQAWVVVIDDLHWADKPTLQLLQFVARELANMNVLVVATYRDTDLVRTHPLSEALAELNRDAGFTRINLRGLDRREVAAYLAQRASVRPSPALVDRVYEETEGNPFFLSEVVNVMAEEGSLSTDSVSDISLPDGVREALGRRLDRLSDEANEMLQLAAVAGREFAYDTLAAIEGHDADILLRLVEEALAARVIEESERVGRYRFTHALMQETLLEELSTTRKVRLHGEVAEALERRWGTRADEHAATLARHYGESALLAPMHAAKAVHYLMLAGEQAEETYGWAAATRDYERALALIDEAPQEDLPEDIAGVAAKLGAAAVMAEEFRLAWRSLNRALDIYRERSDHRQFARAAIHIQGRWAPFDRATKLWEEALERLPDDDYEARTPLLIRLAHAQWPGDGAKGIAKGRVDDLRALQSAFPSPEAERALGQLDSLLLAEQGEFIAANQLLDEVPEQQGYITDMPSLVDTRLAIGNIGRVRAWLEERVAYARRVRDAFIFGNATALLASMELLTGDFVRYAELDGESASVRTYWWSCLRTYSAAIFESDLDRAISMMPDPSDVGGLEDMVVHLTASRACTLKRAGQHDRAQEEWARVEGSFRSTLNRANQRSSIALLDEAGPEIGGETLHTYVQEMLLAPEAPGGQAVATYLAPVSFQRVLGDWQRSYNNFDDAADRYQKALEWCEENGCIVEAGRCHLGLAQVAQQRTDLAAAREHLDAAGALFSQSGARYFVDQVIAQKEILKA